MSASKIEAQAGDLHVNRRDGVRRRRCRGKACAPSDDMMAGIELEMTRDAKRAAHPFGDTSGGMAASLRPLPYATLDLTVTLPAKPPVKVTGFERRPDAGTVSVARTQWSIRRPSCA